MLSKECDDFLALVRLGIGHPVPILPNTIDWGALRALAMQQGLYAVVLDGIEKLPTILKPSQEIVLEWIGEVLQSYEYTYDQYCKTIAEMAGFYNGHGYKMMVLKGYACGLDWSKPNHRPCGDIDIWQFGQQKEADALLRRDKGVEIDNTHHHHTVFNWGEFTVENHYDFINIHHHKSNAELEKLFKELGRDDSHSVEVHKQKVYLPSPNLHALFLLKHIMMHFAAEGIMLRQVLDWGYYVKAHTHEIDWIWMEGILKKYGMLDMYNIINAICVEDFGFGANIFHRVLFIPGIKERVLNEIIFPKYVAELPDGFLKRLIFKVRRWKGSAWKHRLCYKESMWSAFWSGVWNHLLKPSSI
jgi:hypothetical protein